MGLYIHILIFKIAKVEILIIDAIRYLKQKKKRPSIEAIYNKMRNDDPDINDEEFCEIFKILERKDIIRNIKPNEDNRSYTLCEEMLVKSYIEKNENDLHNSLHERIINLLTDQVDFLKDEIKQKNEIIRRLCECTQLNNHNNENESKFGHGESFPERHTVKESNITTTNINNEKQQQLQQQHQQEEQKRKAELLSQQLISIRENKHQTFMMEKYPDNVMNNKWKKQENNNVNENSTHLWKPNTVLIVGDSMLNGLIEKRIGNNVKVRLFSGARIKDMYSYLVPLMEKKPKHVIVHISTNDAVNKTHEELTNEMLQLKEHIEKELPESIIIISFPTIRTDNKKADYALTNLRESLSILNINSIDNSNINESHLSKAGLHLNEKGKGKLAMNYISYIRHL